MNATDWSILATFGDRISAQALVGLLDSEKLPCRLISNEPLPGLGTQFAVLVPQELRQLLAIEILEQRKDVGHEFCFSLQVMQTRVQGIALSRAGAIGSPQSRHIP